MQLKPEALNALKLPVKVKAGFLGSVKLKVPWSKLGKEPVIVLLDRIFVLAEPQTNVEAKNDASMQEEKSRKIQEMESAMLDAKFGGGEKTEVNNSWLGSLISTIIGNLKLSITNIHIRYEDSESNLGHPFAIGLTLKKLAAVTVDENGKETFISSGPLDRIQKAGELEGLALYLDPDTKLWKPAKPWENLSQEDWSNMFEPGIEVQSCEYGSSNGAPMRKCHYLLQPVGASARYTKSGSGDARTADKELQKAVLRFYDVTLSCSQAQYRDVLKLGENFSTLNKRIKYSQYRPSSTVKENPQAWWKYAYTVIAEQLRKGSGRMTWDQIVRFTRLRKKYLSSYINCLQSNPNSAVCNDNKEIQKLERDLDVDVAVQWRMLAHSYVDKNRKDETSRKQQPKGGWLSFLWGNQSSDDSNESRTFSEEDWKQLNEVIGYQETSDSSILPGQDPPDMLHTVLEIHMQHNATKLMDDDAGNIIELSAEELQCNSKLYGEMKLFDFKLGSYKLTSPEGLLAESESQTKAIGGEFILKPIDKSVDWSLSAQAAPCYITYLKASIDEVLNFFSNSDAVSQTVALETAAALQATFGEVARSAQQQLNEALKQRPQFSLYLDIAAPKIIVPSEFYPDGKRLSKLLLDLGHLTLQTEEPSLGESQEEQDLYMHFRLGLTDVQIFLLDGDFDWRDHYNVSSGSPGRLKFQDSGSHFSVLERCGIAVALQQICVPHPAYPTTRVAVRLPSLGFQFSPARYHRLMQVFKMFQSDSSKEDEKAFRPWDPADFEGEVSVLVWKGVGNREAVWQRSYAALAGPFLYVLDSPSATSAKRRVSFNGKQVIAVPPESIGGVTNVLAVCDGGQFNNKVAESVNTLLLRFDDEETRDAWLGRLQAAVYRSSAPAAVSEILASSDKEEDNSESNEKIIANVAEKEKIFLTGALDELKIVISSGPMGRKKSREQILLAKESPLVELRALGSKVEFAMRQFDMSIGAVLQALEIEDKYSGSECSKIRYLACSDLNISKRFQNGAIQDTMHDARVGKPGKRKGRVQKGRKEQFFDTEEDIGKTEVGEGRMIQNRHNSGSISDFYDAEDHDLADHSSIKDPPQFDQIPGLLPDAKDPLGEESHTDNIQDKFVKAQVLLISLDSPYYNNVDKQLTVSLATLSFFCIRPTILAMLNFTDAITAEVEPDRQHDSSSEDDKGSLSTSQSDESAAKPAFDRKDSVMKGLLGSGKERTMLSLVLIMRQAVIMLNTETGGYLASLAQEDLRCNIKVFPSSFSISASLGNLRISDGSVEPDHPYHYICDTRNPGSTSFIELGFSSFSKDDNDYEGYEYSMKGKLSEIRFVYLNRFIQEISSYFMALAPQNPGYVVKIDNKVTDVERFFTQSEVEGSPAIKLDISLTKPILIMPRETHSRDFLELDVLHIKVVNSIYWIGGEQDNPGAVRLDTTVLHIEDIHLSIGLNGEPGEGIIKKANGLSLSVTRSLRDLWHQVPGVDASITIEELKADLSDKEYQVITECAVSNLAEKANIPPPVCLTDSESDSDEEQKKPTEEVTKDENKGKEERASDQNAHDGSWITILVTADIALVELSLYKGTARDQALATAQVIGVWVAYKVNSIQESYIMASLKSLVVKDDREGTEPALQHMIGKADENDYHIEDRCGSNSFSFDSEDVFSPLTMLVMDAKLSPTIQMVSLRIQQPKVLVAVDFLLAIAEFFVPSLHSTTSDSEDIDQDPLNFREGLYLDQQEFIQERNEVVLTPKSPLVADNPSIDEYVYNGKDNILRLEIEEESHSDHLVGEPLIFIGGGKRLRFKNVVIQNADLLDICVFLGPNSSYSVSESDRVYLQSIPVKQSNNGPASNRKGRSEDSSKAIAEAEKEMVFDLQAIGPELTFYDSMSGHVIPQVTEKLIRAKMDVFSRFVLKGGDMELNAKINGLSVEASSGLNVVEPVNAEVKYSSVSGKQDFHITLSAILANFSFSVLQLVLRLQEDISSFLRITTKQATFECYQFDKIWVDESSLTEQRVTFWRARPPPGFAVLGDSVTPSDEPLAKGVLALNLSLAWFKRPIKFERVWVSRDNDSREVCSIWMPIPPPSYVAFGCIVVQGTDPPPLSSVLCIKERFVTSSCLKDCIHIETPVEGGKPRGAFWRVDNSLGSFFVESGNHNSVMPKPFELLQVACSLGFPKVKISDPNAIRGAPTSEDVLGEQSAADNVEQSQPTPGLAVPRELCEPVAGFKLVWWNKGDNANDKISIWRPILPPGCCFAGDLAVEGYEPPSAGLVFRNQHEGLLLKKPSDFVSSGHIKKQRAFNELFIWFPLAPPGYTALGCVATESEKIDPDIVASFECIRNDSVVQSHYVGKTWSNERSKRMDEILSVWSVGNELGTFIVQKGSKTPPKRLAFRLVESQQDNEPDNLVVDAELRTLSAVIYDDFRGLMIPLLNVSFAGVNASSHGRTDSLCSTLHFSVTAMTYNGKCYAWEPLIEPFDGVVRHNYKKSSSKQNGTTSQLRIVSTNIFNANISVNNLNMMLEAYASWNTLSKLMENSKADTMAGKASKRERKQPALEFRHKKSFQVIHHNKLGEDLLIRCVDINGQLKIVPLPSGGTASIQLPTSSSILDPSLKVNIDRMSVRIVAILLGSSKIRSSDSFGDQKYMATVRIFPQLQTADSFQLDQQSGRTRCVTPTKSADSGFQVVEWNEVFFCEMGREDSCTVEIMITELATGAAVGYCSFPLASSARDSSIDTEKKGDARPVCMFNIKREALKPPQKSKNGESSDNGEVWYSIYCFPTLKDEEQERSDGGAAKDLRPGTIQVSYKNRECWREIGLNYAASATCWRLGDDTIATETTLDDMHKEITFRSLVVIKNETEFLLDVRLSEKLTNKAHVSSSGIHTTVPDSFGSSLIDGNNHSKVTDNLSSDNEKRGDVQIHENERDQSLRSRKSAGMHGTDPFLLGTLHPQESITVPITTLRPESPDYVFQIRLQEETGSNGQSDHLFEWSNFVCCKGHTEPKGKQKSNSEVSLHSLVEAEQLIQCCKEAGSSSEHLKSLWFVFDIKARDRGTSPQLDPLKDWQIEIVAPLVLQNFLPVSSEYTVLEKSSGNNLILREKGVIEPGQKAYLYGVDIRQALYLTWIPQGGWQPEDVPVLISHPFKQVARHITLKHFRTQRPLNVLVDHSSNGKDTIARRIRFYVPCWLDVKKIPPVYCNFAELKDKNRLHVHLDSKATSNIKILEIVQPEEMDGQFTMLSNFNIEKMGIFVALAETCFPDPTSLAPLSQADESVELRALDETGSRCYKILASTKLCPYQGIPTKILLLRPYTTYTNRLGEPLWLSQTPSDEPKTLAPSDWRVNFPLPVTDEPERLQVRLGDTHWCVPFSIKQEGTFYISLRENSSRRHVRMEVRGYEEGSRYLVVFRRGLSYGPYRFENRMRDMELQYRQKGSSDENWQLLQPCSASLYVWENLEGEELLEVLVAQDGVSDCETYDINKPGKYYHQQMSCLKNYFCEILEVGSVKVVKFCEFSENSHEKEPSTSGTAEPSQPLTVDVNPSSSSSRMEVQLELGQLGISLIDLKLRELLYLYMEKVSFVYATGYAGNLRRLKFFVGYFQLDNQLPFSVLPVVLVPEEKNKNTDPILKISVTICDQASDAVQAYPYIGVKVTKSAWRVNIHEPIIWAVLGFYNELHLDKVSGDSDVGQVDPEMRFDLIDVSEIRLKLTVETAPRQRPRGILGIWSPFLTALGNTSKMPIHLRSVVHTNRYMRKSALTTAIVNRLRRELIHNPLMLLSGVDVLGMTSSTLATLSETFAELSSDGRFLQLRLKLDRSRRIGGVGDGLVQGTEAFAQGIAYGVSGVIRKPLEKAKEKGVIGFIQGLGKAALGVVMEPMSGVVDFVSFTVHGIGASCTKCFELFEQRPTFERVRLPRFIPPSGVLCCFDEKSAEGQYMLQLAEGKGRFHQGVLFREPSKFAWSDIYVDHFDVMNNKVAMLTNDRAMLLQRPKSHVGAKFPTEPCFILWDVPWQQLLALELANTGSDQSPTFVVLHLCNQCTPFAHLIKFSSTNSDEELLQARTFLRGISKAWKSYGPSRKQILQQVGVKRPYRTSSAPPISVGPMQLGGSDSEAGENQVDSSSGQGSTTEIQRQKEVFNFAEIWASEQVAGFSLCVDMIQSKDDVVTIWRPIVPEGYVSIGDIAYIGKHPPLVSVAYRYEEELFKHPIGFDLVWRSWKEGFIDPISLWMPRAPEGYYSLGCIAMAAHIEPDVNDVWCAHSSIVEDASFEDQEIWHSPNNSAWACFVFQVSSEALTFMAVRQAHQRTHIRPRKVALR
ncbi:hypothetical protein GOP47_0012501 [Adiantum capillus-veneris]|uniref:PH domain-containing protein n=1 Tax=Adiantum capillus-veneris TaxID=13818 RepID=A0A9D4UR48_ADICA|nr:hypothetical protein GOP47_0012501 [Adiantum capillus-veneris]